MGRLGAAKRRMLSLAERPSPEVAAACEGVVSLAGAAEGIVAGLGAAFLKRGWAEASVSQSGARGSAGTGNWCGRT